MRLHTRSRRCFPSSRCVHNRNFSCSATGANSRRGLASSLSLSDSAQASLLRPHRLQHAIYDMQESRAVSPTVGPSLLGGASVEGAQEVRVAAVAAVVEVVAL